ncbi:hypothetical protein [Vibrio parahaemolyticus]|uniref:hypothetical protein n=1 Tax=Vibrio parahaemolyticus TaxID=670 RepID=UPI000429D078
MLFMDAWHFLMEHKIFNVKDSTTYSKDSLTAKQLGLDWKAGTRLETRRSRFEDSLSVVVLGERDAPVICLEAGGLIQDENGEIVTTHDYDLDVSAPSFEQAVIMLAAKVSEKYGDDVESAILSQERTL